MITVEQFMDIKILKQEGLSIRQIAERTGQARNTVRKVLRGEHSGKFNSPQRSSKLNPFKDYLRQRFEQFGLSAVRLLEEIRPMGYQGSAVTVRRYLNSLKSATQRSRKVTVRFETAPGQQAQADWTYCGKFPGPDGKPISVYAFVMVLAWSRMTFIKFTTSMKLPELIQCHQEAFAYFGGWTQSILYDNMKQVRIGPGRLNEAFADFAKHHGFAIKTHRAYRPRTKGKVERLVDYVKDNFLAGRTFHGIDDLNAQGLHWMNHVANVRVHGTTGRVPQEAFVDERLQLIPLSSVSAYHFHDPVTRTANWESMVRFGGSKYSVPPQFAGQVVQVYASGGKIEIRSADCVIAEHVAAARCGQSIVCKEHLAELWKITAQQVEPPPDRPRWNIEFSNDVEQVPLSRFEQFLDLPMSLAEGRSMNRVSAEVLA